MRHRRTALVAALLLGPALAGCGGGSPAGTTNPPAATTPSGAGSTGAGPGSSGASTSSGASPTPTPTSPSVTPTATAAPSTPAVPPVSAAARAFGLVDVRTLVPDAVIDLRYATTNNFTHVQLYPADARCLVHQSMGPGLVEAARRLRAQGDVIVFWDCYRPHAAQVRMFQVVPDPNWVARPGPYATSHEAARSVDVTLAAAPLASGCPAARVVPGRGLCLVDMGTDFDDFTPRGTAYATAGLTRAQVANRAVLRQAFQAAGLPIYSGEWWHFDTPDADTPRPHLAVPVT